MINTLTTLDKIAIIGQGFCKILVNFLPVLILAVVAYGIVILVETVRNR